MVRCGEQLLEMPMADTKLGSGRGKRGTQAERNTVHAQIFSSYIPMRNLKVGRNSFGLMRPEFFRRAAVDGISRAFIKLRPKFVL
jgi:hypothetical protein